MLGSFNGKREGEIKDRVWCMIGQDDALGGLLSPKQMRLHEFPADATRKITEFEVRTAVMEYLKRRYGSDYDSIADLPLFPTQ